MTDTTPPVPPAEPTPPVTPPPAAVTPPVTPPPVTPPPAVTPPTPPAAAPNAYAPAAPGAYAPAAPGPKQTLSLVSFIVGIGAFVLSFVIGIGLIPGIVAVILGFRARKTEKAAPQWMSLIGIIGGFVAIGFSIIFGLIFIASVLVPLIFLSSYGYTY
jgi:hypothetical protein